MRKLFPVIYLSSCLLAAHSFAGSAASSVDAFDTNVPAQTSGRWAATGSMTTARAQHTATLLPGGKVLASGGFNDSSYLASAELYDPATRLWTATGSMAAARAEHAATLLPNGKVLIAGGNQSGASLASAELYDPATGLWTATPSMTNMRYGHTATLLPNGQVLVTGGYNGAYLASAELYNPATGLSEHNGQHDYAAIRAYGDAADQRQGASRWGI